MVSFFKLWGWNLYNLHNFYPNFILWIKSLFCLAFSNTWTFLPFIYDTDKHSRKKIQTLWTVAEKSGRKRRRLQRCILPFVACRKGCSADSLKWSHHAEYTILTFFYQFLVWSQVLKSPVFSWCLLNLNHVGNIYMLEVGG